MKAQKLGLVLGVNMAVACLVFQGCKVTRPDAKNMPPPEVDSSITTTESAPVVDSSLETTAPVQSSVVTTTTVVDVDPVVEPVVGPTSQVATVKPLPSAKKPVVAPLSSEAPADVTASAGQVTAVDEAATGTVVVVQRGDTLSGICVRNHVKMSAIIAANPGLNPNRIRVGQKLKIPGATAAVAKSAKVMNASASMPIAANVSAPVKTKSSFKSYNGPTKEYKVRNGDSLGKLAYENGITIRALKEMNKLTKDGLRVGQTLHIPAEKVVAENVKAESAKVLETKKPVEEKASSPVKVSEGKPAPAVPVPVVEPVPAAAPVASTTIVNSVSTQVPAEKSVAPATEVAPAENQSVDSDPVEAPASSMTYTVKEGDDIVGVAIAWGISPSQLMDLNNLKAGESISVGRVLKLPANAKQNGQ